MCIAGGNEKGIAVVENSKAVPQEINIQQP